MTVKTRFAGRTHYTYAYDLGDRLSSETDNAVLTTYTYDATNQLTRDGITSHTYDANGNRTSFGYQTGPNNQLISDGTWTYSYDAEGNRTKKTKGASAETWTYGYDNLNHLVWAEDRATDGGTLIQRVDFKYDVLNNLIEKDVTIPGSGVTTQRYAYDGQNVWADLDGTNALQTRYLRGDVVDQIFARMKVSGAVAWFDTDHLGSVRDLTDGAGTLQDHINYDGFGTITSESNPSFGDRYKYTGREWVVEVGLQYNRARFYDPLGGRWISLDPQGFGVTDTNLYRYVENSPTKFIDPSGLQISLSVAEEMDNGCPSGESRRAGGRVRTARGRGAVSGLGGRPGELARPGR